MDFVENDMNTKMYGTKVILTFEFLKNVPHLECGTLIRFLKVCDI